MSEKFAIDILVLDDEPFMLELVGHMLLRLGYSRIHRHDNGQAALRAVEDPANVPALILLDINMPSMDGLAFVRHLSACNYRGGLILVSGEDELMLQATVRLALAFDLTVIGSLRKPPAPEELAKLLDKQAAERNSRSLSNGRAYGAQMIAEAIEEGQFVNHYQPKVAVGTGAFVGAEALVRWHHPEDGLVLPDRFIPQAEEHGLIGRITRPVIKRALAQVRAWRAAGLSLRVAVNVSMEDLSQLEFADFVVAETRAAEVSPQSLVLEVTESRLIRNLTTVLEVLTRLRLKRFQLAIDDFGTGHSSLTQLCSLPMDELKIDRSFIHGAWQDSRLRAIVEASADLGSRIGMNVVAEGVEDLDDWNFVRATDCHVAQGHYISVPIPAVEIPPWFDGWRMRIEPEHLAHG